MHPLILLWLFMLLRPEWARAEVNGRPEVERRSEVKVDSLSGLRLSFALLSLFTSLVSLLKLRGVWATRTMGPRQTNRAHFLFVYCSSLPWFLHETYRHCYNLFFSSSRSFSRLFDSSMNELDEWMQQSALQCITIIRNFSFFSLSILFIFSNHEIVQSYKIRCYSK